MHPTHLYRSVSRTGTFFPEEKEIIPILKGCNLLENLRRLHRNRGNAGFTAPPTLERGPARLTAPTPEVKGGRGSLSSLKQRIGKLVSHFEAS